MLAPAGDVYQAGTLSGNPLAVAAGLATLAAARRSRLRAAGGDAPSASPTACARRRPAPSARSGRLRAGPADGVLLRAAGRATSPTRRRCDLDAYGALVPRAARARRLPAAVAVRGVVPVARARARADRAHGRSGRGGVRRAARGRRRGAAMSAATLERLRALLRGGGRPLIGALLDAPAPMRRRAWTATPGARSPPSGPARARARRRVRAARRGDLRGLPAALRRRRASCARRDADLRAARRRPALRDRARAAGRARRPRRRCASWPT